MTTLFSDMIRDDEETLTSDHPLVNMLFIPDWCNCDNSDCRIIDEHRGVEFCTDCGGDIRVSTEDCSK